ncbi:MAG: redoxin domain-containing protein [Pseudomonadota bacterium]
MRAFSCVNAFVFGFFVLLTASAQAGDGPLVRGPAIGSVAAFAVPMVSSEDAQVTLKQLQGPKGTALFFNRSLNWCPYCKNQTQDLIDKAALLKDAGYGIAVITYDTPLLLADYAKKTSPGFPLLSDPESKTIIAWGLLNEKYEPGSFAYGIPHPMIVVVDTDNRVTAKFAEEGYKERPVLEEVVAALTN